METITERLKNIKLGQQLQIADQSGTEHVLRIESWKEDHGDSDHIKLTDRSFSLIQTGKALYCFIPEQEGGKPAWFRFVATETIVLRDEVMNYAREFGKNRQKPGSVSFELLGTKWCVTDIGLEVYKVQDGEDETHFGEGRCRHLLANDGKGKWLFFVDHLEGPGGHDQCYIGQQIVDPEEYFKSIE